MISKNLEENIQTLKKVFQCSSDFYVRTIQKKISYVLLESLCSDDKISDFFMKEITRFDYSNLFSSIKNTIPNNKLKTISDMKEIIFYLQNGFTIIFIEGEQNAIGIETKNSLNRGIESSNNEVVLRGPKDSFTENILLNMGLIRKRIKDTNLSFQEFVIGRRTKTKVILSYLKDLIDEKKRKQIEKKLNNIDIDSILDSSTIKEFLSTWKTAFPTILSTERPDLVSMALLEGKFIILVDNSPIALIIPGLFIDYLHNTEDEYLSPINSSFTRVLRILCFFITLLTPAIYVSIITFNKNLISKSIYETLTVQREGLFVSAFLEIFLLVTVFEILRESDIRIPNKMGTSIGVVGALVLGDAAVSAGLVSSIAVIITAITAISGLLFSDIDFVYALRIWRYLFLVGAACQGLIGVFVIFIVLLFHLMHLKSLDIPYLSPIYPFQKEEVKKLWIRVSKRNDTNRPSYLKPKDKIKKK